MKVRAIALGEERSNAIGTIELECTPFGLVIGYLGVGSFSEGYAPGALTQGTVVTVNFTQVRAARFEGERLYLELAPETTPHHKLVLGNFSVPDGTHQHEVYRQRLVLRTGAFGAAAIGALLGALLVPRISPSSSAALALGIAAVIAVMVLTLGFVLDRRLVSGTLDGESARQVFAAELRVYLPQLVRLDRPPPRAPKPFPLPDFQGLLPRTTAAIAITLTAGGLAAVLLAKWMLSDSHAEREALRAASEAEELGLPEPQALQAPPPLDLDAPAAQAPPAPVAPVPAPPSEPTPAPASSAGASTQGDAVRTGACQCTRATSLMWQSAVPKLSVLVLTTRLAQDGSRKRLELEVAVVNNSNEELSDVTLRVNFYERDPAPSSRRTFSQHRVLFFEGPLTPGQAIKWSTDARGVEFELENPVAGDIGPGGDGAAPADAFAELLNANHRPVRMHGAMMLAYLGDPRARDGVLKLQDALREDEAPYLRRVLGTLGDVKPCELNVTGSGPSREISACIYNASKSPLSDVVFRVNALESGISLAHPVGQPPAILGEAAWDIPGTLAAGQGARVKTSFNLGLINAEGAAAFEVLAGRRGQDF